MLTFLFDECEHNLEGARARTNRTPGSKAEDAEEEEEDGVGGLTEGLGMRPEYEFCARDEATLTRLSSMCRKTAIVFVLASAVSLIQMVTESYFAGESSCVYRYRHNSMLMLYSQPSMCAFTDHIAHCLIVRYYTLILKACALCADTSNPESMCPLC